MNRSTQICPRCEHGRLRSFIELSDQEQEVVRKLPASASYSMADREARHLWCARCWYERTGEEPWVT